MRHNLIRTLVLASILGGTAITAWAHAIIASAQPTAGATVPGPNIDIVLTYNVRIDADRSKLSLTGPDGQNTDIAIAPDSAADVLRGQAAGLAAGAYILHWQVLASDGHITRGDVPFTVAP